MHYQFDTEGGESVSPELGRGFTQMIKRSLRKHKVLSSVPSTHGGAACATNAGRWRQEGSCWDLLTIQCSREVSSGFSEKPCSKK